jgi:hypothetical protein
MTTQTDGAGLLSSIRDIAAYLGVTERRAKHWHDARLIPTFKVGDAVCARKATLDAHIAAQEAAASGNRGFGQ